MKYCFCIYYHEVQQFIFPAGIVNIARSRVPFLVRAATFLKEASNSVTRPSLKVKLLVRHMLPWISISLNYLVQTDVEGPDKFAAGA